MDSRKWWLLLGLAVVLLLGGGTVWALHAFQTTEPAPEPVVLEMKGAMQELAQDVRNGTPMANKAELLARMASMGQEMRDLSPEQRKLAMKNFNAVAGDFMKNYFSLSKEEQTKQLDSVIDMMQFAQKMGSLFGARRRNPDGQPQDQGAGGGSGNQASTAAQGQNSGPGGNMTPAQRDAWGRDMISNMTTPEQRAMFAEFGRQLQQRAQERGVSFRMRTGG
jgi:hypothetical protein